MIDISSIPTEVKVDAIYLAQTAALKVIEGSPPSVHRVNLFWLTYNFEFRVFIERWLKENADVKA